MEKNEKNIVQDELIGLIQYVREHAQENIEFEVRLGQFTTENEFESGFQLKDMQLFVSLKNRIENNVKKLKQWKIEATPYVMMRCEYEGGVRKTCKDSQTTYMIKRRLKKLDIRTDRPLHFRVSVSRETKLNINPSHYMYETVTKKPPKSVRYIHRMSFRESTYVQTEKDEITFQWDLSKVSPAEPTKKKTTEKPCTYHVEFELVTQLKRLESPEKEAESNEILANLIMERIRALSGTHTKEVKEDIPDKKIISFIPLPPTGLYLVAKDV